MSDAVLGNLSSTEEKVIELGLLNMSDVQFANYVVGLADTRLKMLKKLTGYEEWYLHNTARGGQHIKSMSDTCDCCGEPYTWSGQETDHCHTTDYIRGSVHGHCNRMFGFAREQPTKLILGANYLLKNDKRFPAPGANVLHYYAAFRDSTPFYKQRLDPNTIYVKGTTAVINNAPVPHKAVEKVEAIG